MAVMKRQLRTRINFLRPFRTKKIVQHNQKAPGDGRAKTKLCTFAARESVLAQNYTKVAKWIPATVIAKTGLVETNNHLIWRQHVDKLLRDSGATNYAPQPAHLVSETDTVATRRSFRQLSQIRYNPWKQ
ncbi:hypothetical protein GOODEAATRI_034162, partial [Goodea atripinnis]